MSKHTPGPWTEHVMTDRSVRNIEGRFETADITIGSGETMVAVTEMRRAIGDHSIGYPCAKTVEEMEANARLIAAAPELLASLSAMLTYFGMDEDEWSKPVVDKARAAIAKATGQA